MDKNAPFKKIAVKQPSDLIIEQIHELITMEELKPGQRLPSEPDLASQFGTSRAQVRLAFKKLESYGILETRPQSGTYIAEIGTKILDGLLSNVSHINSNFEPLSIVEARLFLESESVKLAASKITDEQLQKVIDAHTEYKKHAENGITDSDDDIYFHLKIAEYSGNPVIRHLICLITPQMLELIKSIQKFQPNNEERLKSTVKEHEEIIEALRQKNPQTAQKAMERHISAIKSTVIKYLKVD